MCQLFPQCWNTHSLPLSPYISLFMAESTHKNRYAIFNVLFKSSISKAVFILSCWDDRAFAHCGISSHHGSLLWTKPKGIFVPKRLGVYLRFAITTEQQTDFVLVTKVYLFVSSRNVWLLMFKQAMNKGSQTHPWLHGHQCLRFTLHQMNVVR